MTELALGLIGAGTIGRTHLTAASSAPGVEIRAVADPGPRAKALAAEFGARWFPDHEAMCAAMPPLDGAIVAAPNRLHGPLALDCLARGLPVLVEKPLAPTAEEARSLVAAAARAGLPLLVGHHRRYNAAIQQARVLVRQGALGRLVTASAMAAMLKPDGYFDVPWRTEPGGGGPILINLIHEVDQLRFLCGEIVAVQAAASSATRRLAVEDTAAAILHFESGALATIVLSDTAASPWVWDQATEDLPMFPKADVETHFLCGTEGSLSLPGLRLWRYAGGVRSWTEPLTVEDRGVPWRNPYQEQLRHFGAVIRGEEAPMASGLDGLRALEVIAAVQRSAATGERVAALSPHHPGPHAPSPA